MTGFRGMTFQKSLEAFSGEKVYSKAELDAAIAAEREECARLLEEVGIRLRGNATPTTSESAAIIRARGKK